jgi:hypothetical protein
MQQMRDDEIRIELVPPDTKLPEDEIWEFGVMRWRYMTREELEEKYPSKVTVALPYNKKDL